MHKVTNPIICIVGAPHSYTSMVSNFLINNGGSGTELEHGTKEILWYDRYEDKEVLDFVNKGVIFKNEDINPYIDELPKDKTVIIKVPRLLYFLNEIKSDRVKVVYVIRNPEDNIRSHMKKNDWSFINIFNKYCWFYDFAIKARFPLYPLLSERLLRKDYSTAKQLLDFCRLPSEKIDFSNIKEVKEPRPTYIKYRFSNFVWKRISGLFKVLLK